MDETNISFVSTMKHGMNIDLKLLKDYLAKYMENGSFRYFINEGEKGNEMVRSGRRDRKDNFCRQMKYAVCIDASLSKENIQEDVPGARRILLALPFESWFKKTNLLKDGKEVPLEDLSVFTHIMVTSPFMEMAVRKTSKLHPKVHIEKTVSPFVWDALQPEREDEARGRFAYYFPAMQGKKVLAVLTAGKVKEEAETIFDSLNLEGLLNDLGSDWFLITNNGRLLERYASLSSRYKDVCGYVDRVLAPRDLICFSDALLTNSSIYAYYFVARKKPVFCVPYKNNQFEKYVKTNYPELYMESMDDLADAGQRLSVFSPAHEKFYDEFSNKADENPGIKVAKIIEEI